ncbi:hypothetical protein [Bacillus thuringiensis]|uniref:hypothetical protein n=1 Tax=Bacillus thuringiensis TaxID=1428 RepID=UPI000BFDD2D2|nr:hypothetical protein [Bacillus thuringiensis]PGM52866.1 hypothetical protein CN949_08920 [Bacillus thuringiensis]
MKRFSIFILIGAIASALFLGENLVFAQSNLNSDFRSISSDKYEPIGDPDMGYPQMAIRTNRTPQRTDLESVIRRANQVADQYPIEDKKNRAKAVTEELTEIFGGGGFGHTWIIFFKSAKPGNYTSYGYHAGYGFVKDGQGGGRNDSPERKFHVERIIPIKNTNAFPDQLEQTIIPKLNKYSVEIAELMDIPVSNPDVGAYTPITNCSWFAGNLWNYATGDNLVFEQDFNGADYADRWGMPFLKSIKKIADPGMVAESIAR